MYKSSIYSTQDHTYFQMVIRPTEDRYELTQVVLDDSWEPLREAPLATSIDATRLMFAVDHFVQYGDLPGISYRQTRKGDWLVCAVAHATYGIGVHRSGSVAPGYTTGRHYGRYQTEAIAQAEAERIASETGATVVQWQHPSKNPQFIDLQKKYPTRTTYSTLADAGEDGWISINPSKTIHHYNGHVIYVRDITPGSSFGYELAVAVKGQDRLFARSAELWANSHPGRTTGVFDICFRTGDVVDAIHAACLYIDGLVD